MRRSPDAIGKLRVERGDRRAEGFEPLAAQFGEPPLRMT